ncbi:HNH endonuclease [Bacillus proteolyticus]|uniref:HNH endonuclease n=1 Tax=Bacillus proteolyticus TaxID=2026192 RepID=UPI003CC54C9C
MSKASIQGRTSNLESGGVKGTGNRDADIPPAFKQEKFASTYDSRFKQTPAETNSNVVFEGARGNTARDYNFKQANERLAGQLNNSPELANQFGMEAGGITAKDIEKYRVKNKLTWHELNDGVTIQLVPTEINAKFGYLGGVGEINAGAFEPGGFANK